MEPISEGSDSPKQGAGQMGRPYPRTAKTEGEVQAARTREGDDALSVQEQQYRAVS